MTRFLIAKQVGPDAYRTIAGLCDGYLEHTGAILLEHYNTPEKVDKLLDLGDIHYLGKNLDWPEGITFEEKQNDRDGTMAFARDFGDVEAAAEVLSMRELDSPKSRNDYVYIFTANSQWAYFKGGMSQLGLLDLRDSINRLLTAPSPKYITTAQSSEEVYVYKNQSNQSASQMTASNNRLKDYLASRGYEKGGSISICAPMSKCGSNYKDMLDYCRQRGISRIVIDNMKALDGDTATAIAVLKNLCKQGFRVEVAESGAVYDESCFAAQDAVLEPSEGGMVQQI